MAILRARIQRSPNLILVAACLALCALARAQDGRFLGKDPYHWIDQLKSKSPTARRAAAFALGKLGTAAYYTRQGVKPLVECLGERESDAEVRDAAAYSLGEIGMSLRKYPREGATAWDAAGGALMQALARDKDARVRRSAACGIGGFGKAAVAARDRLRTALKDDSPGVRQNAAWALGQLGKEDAEETLQALTQVFADADPQVRRDAAAAVGEIGRLRDAGGQAFANPAVAPLLQMFHKEKDDTIRKVALDALVNAVTKLDKDAANDLRGLLADKDPEIVRGAALALGNIGGPAADEAVGELREALAKGDLLTRIQASAALANVGQGAAPAVRDLIVALDDKEPEIRRNAALALSHIGPQAASAVPALARRLRPDETNEQVRTYSAEAIAEIAKGDGDAIVEAVPDLLKAVRNDKTSTVRQRCIWALFQVRDLEALGVVEPLIAVLNEKDDEQVLVRYDAARCLGIRLRGKAPEKAVDVLVQMLNDKRLRTYEGSAADVTGSGVEGVKGGAKVAMTLGGDARFLAAEALARIGRKADRPDVIKLLNEAANSRDAETLKAAQEALKAIQGKK
jgi:HEAT repeat protein